jgi:hypothetical protein
MSDELRSAPGHRPEQRRNRGAPRWWAELERSDLPPDDDSSTPGGRPPVRSSTRNRPVGTRPAPSRPTRLRTAAITALVVFVAALVAWIGIGGGSMRSVVVVLLIFGVPALLAVVTASIVIRRAG